jgi:hypothetical protein
MTARIATAAPGGADRTGTQAARLGNPLLNLGTPVCQCGQRLRHDMVTSLTQQPAVEVRLDARHAFAAAG